ncbi:glutathione-disulfide reductase, partial [Reticulomyxa filosa]
MVPKLLLTTKMFVSKCATNLTKKKKKKVILFEKKRLGGTCVNVGCVPKKVMWTAANVASTLRHDAPNFGFSFDNLRLDWKTLKERRDNYVKYLNRIYEKNLNDSKVSCVFSHAKFVAPNIVQSTEDGKRYTADNILIGVGGFPYRPDIPGKEYVYTSDDFFNKLDRLPKRVAVVGAGYIAVELAQVLKELGSDVSLLIRGRHPLRKF